MDCRIREWRLTDAQALALALDNERVQANLRDGIPLPYTFQDAEAYINRVLKEQNAYGFAITVDDRAIGSIGAFRKENIHARTAEMGYYIGEPYWGHGLMTSAVRQACEHIFATTDIVRIFAIPYAYNQASCRVLEKAGFIREGVMRKNAFKRGQFLDTILYALVKD